MKKLLFFLLLLPVVCFSQNPPQKINANYQFLSSGADSGGMRVPRYAVLPLHPNANYVRDGALAFNTTDHNYYHWDSAGSVWVCSSCGGGSNPKLDSVYTFMQNLVAGDTSLVLYAGTVRPTSSDGVHIDWKWVSTITPDHATLNFRTDTIGTNGDGFTVYFPHITKAISFLANPDESAVLGAWQFGASFDLDSAVIRITRLHQGAMSVWFDSSIHSPNCIQLETPGADGITTQYDSVTGNFKSFPAYFKANTFSDYVAITTSNNSWLPVYDGAASFGQPFAQWHLIDRATGVVHTGCRTPFTPAAFVLGPTFYTNEVCDVVSGSLLPVNSSFNIWIMAIGKKH